MHFVIVNRNEDGAVLAQQLRSQQLQPRQHHAAPLVVPREVFPVHDLPEPLLHHGRVHVVVVRPTLVPGVVGRVDVDALHLPLMRGQERLQSRQVVALDDEVVVEARGPAQAARPDRPQFVERDGEVVVLHEHPALELKSRHLSGSARTEGGGRGPRGPSDGGYHRDRAGRTTRAAWSSMGPPELRSIRPELRSKRPELRSIRLELRSIAISGALRARIRRVHPSPACSGRNRLFRPQSGSMARSRRLAASRRQPKSVHGIVPPKSRTKLRSNPDELRSIRDELRSIPGEHGSIPPEPESRVGGPLGRLSHSASGRETISYSPESVFLSSCLLRS